MDLDIFQWSILGAFLVGFFLIAFGSKIIDSLLASFLTAVTCWLLIALRYFYGGHHFETDAFYHHLGDTANIVFFLIFALLIVEVVKEYNGFQGLTRFFKVMSSENEIGIIKKFNIACGFDKKTEINTNTLYFNHLLCVVSLTSFFLASVIDNVTAALIITVAVAQIIENRKLLYFLAFFGGAVAANAGGTFSPIGEITTTQLWAGGQITFLKTVFALFLPSLISIIVPLAVYCFSNKNEIITAKNEENYNENKLPFAHTRLVILTALFAMLLVVPILKGHFGLPPMIGALAAFCLLWVVVAWSQQKITLLNQTRSENEQYTILDIKSAFARLEWETPLFFLGILLAVSALKEQQILQNLGKVLSDLPIAYLLGIVGIILTMFIFIVRETIKPFAFLVLGLGFCTYFYQDILQQPIINLIIGFVSSVMDNVALVATVQGMYNTTMQGYESDTSFWFLLSFCAGTGGSMLVIGSAAGVAVRSKLQASYGGKEYTENGENVNLDKFFIKNITYWAAINYVTGFLICLLKYIF
jgi:Na+/H+ antiporter NhaD/arsenite permease-like protein